MVAGGQAHGITALRAEFHRFCLNPGCRGKAETDAALGLVL